MSQKLIRIAFRKLRRNEQQSFNQMVVNCIEKTRSSSFLAAEIEMMRGNRSAVIKAAKRKMIPNKNHMTLLKQQRPQSYSAKSQNSISRSALTAPAPAS